MRILKSKRQIMAARSMVLKKNASAFHAAAPEGLEEYKAYTITRLYVPAKGHVQVYTTTLPAGRESPYVEPFVGQEMVNGIMFDRFTRAFLNVRVDTSKDPKGMCKFLNKIYCLDGRYFVKAMEEGFVVELTTGKLIDDSILYFEGDLREGVYVYGDRKQGCMTATSGQVKKQEITFPCNNLPGFNYPEILNDLTFGMIDQLRKNIRKADKVKPVAQLSTRIGQIKAPAVEGKHLGNFAVFMGIYSDLWDGSMYCQDTFAADWYADRLGDQFAVLPSAVRGTTLQCRPYMCKGNASVVSKQYLNRFLIRQGWEPEIIERSKFDEKQQEEFNKAVWSKGAVGDYAGKLVVICDKKEDLTEHGIQFFTDLNGLKETFDIKKYSGLNVLDTTEEGDDTIKTSTQTFSTFLVCNDTDAQNLFMEKTEMEIEHAYQDIMREEGIAPHADAFNDATNFMQLGFSLFPKFFREQWRPGYSTMVGNTIEGLNRKVANLNLSNEGAYCVFVVDAAIDFGFNSLKFENGRAEVFCRDLGKDNAMLVRFPKANAFGFSEVIPVSEEELIERAMKAGLTGKDLEDYSTRIESQAEGIVMLPASQALMDKHDGHDFDGDHGQLTKDKMTYALVEHKSSAVVHICDDEEFAEAKARHTEVEQPLAEGLQPLC